MFTHLKLIEKEKFSQIKINFISFFPYLPFFNDQNNKKKETCPCLLLYRTTLYIFILLRYFLIQISEGGRRKYFLIAISCLDSFPKFFILTFFRNHICLYSKRKKKRRNTKIILHYTDQISLYKNYLHLRAYLGPSFLFVFDTFDQILSE